MLLAAFSLCASIDGSFEPICRAREDERSALELPELNNDWRRALGAAAGLCGGVLCGTKTIELVRILFAELDYGCLSRSEHSRCC